MSKIVGAENDEEKIVKKMKVKNNVKEKTFGSAHKFLFL